MVTTLIPALSAMGAESTPIRKKVGKSGIFRFFLAYISQGGSMDLFDHIFKQNERIVVTVFNKLNGSHVLTNHYTDSEKCNLWLNRLTSTDVRNHKIMVKRNEVEKEYTR